MSATHCLNCNTPLHGAYCHACGQKGSTHRLSLKHFLTHDLLHGLWHLDGSLPRTLKNVLTRPGRAAIAYLGGKRAGQFNLVTLMIILIGLNLAITPVLYPHGRVASVGGLKMTSNGEVIRPEDPPLPNEAKEDAKGREFAAKAQAWMDKNSKWIILGLVPIVSVVSVVVFRRARFNYAEHLLINSFFLTGVLASRLIAILLEWSIERLAHTEGVHIFPFLALAYLALLYWQAHRARYRFAGWAWRLLALFFGSILVFMVLAIGLAAVYMLLTGRGANGIIQVG